MDTLTTIIGLTLLAIFVLPFVIMGRKRNKLEKKHMQAFLAVVKENDSAVTKVEQDGDIIIGLDENSNRLFFQSVYMQEYTSVIIDLNKVKTCQVIRTIKEGIIDTGDTYSIAKLVLSFLPSTSADQTPAIDIYDYKKKVQISSELLFSREWVKTINDHLNRNQGRMAL